MCQRNLHAWVDKPGIQADELLCLLKLEQAVSFGNLHPFIVRKIGDFPSFLLALASNNACPGGTSRGDNIWPTNLRKNAISALVGCSIVSLKVATLEGTLDDSCHPQDLLGWRKAHFVT